MAKPICSLVILNLKEITRIVGNSILPAKRSSLVQFKNLDQLKTALKLQENHQIEIKSTIPMDIHKLLHPEEPQEEHVPVVESEAVEVEAESLVEESVEEEVNPVEEEAKPKRKRNGKNS